MIVCVLSVAAKISIYDDLRSICIDMLKYPASLPSLRSLIPWKM